MQHIHYNTDLRYLFFVYLFIFATVYFYITTFQKEILFFPSSMFDSISLQIGLRGKTHLLSSGI